MAPRRGQKASAKTRWKMSLAQRGRKGSNWRGGRRKTQGGYIMIYQPRHPRCDKNHCVPEQRLVMERVLGRYLTPIEKVHHINGNKADNRLCNLRLFATRAEHSRHHFPKGSMFGANQGKEITD